MDISETNKSIKTNDTKDTKDTKCVSKTDEYDSIKWLTGC